MNRVVAFEKKDDIFPLLDSTLGLSLQSRTKLEQLLVKWVGLNESALILPKDLRILGNIIKSGSYVKGSLDHLLLNLTQFNEERKRSVEKSLSIEEVQSKEAWVQFERVWLPSVQMGLLLGMDTVVREALTSVPYSSPKNNPRIVNRAVFIKLVVGVILSAAFGEKAMCDSFKTMEKTYLPTLNLFREESEKYKGLDDIVSKAINMRPFNDLLGFRVAHHHVAKQPERSFDEWLGLSDLWVSNDHILKLLDMVFVYGLPKDMGLKLFVEKVFSNPEFRRNTEVVQNVKQVMIQEFFKDETIAPLEKIQSFFDELYSEGADVPAGIKNVFSAFRLILHKFSDDLEKSQFAEKLLPIQQSKYGLDSQDYSLMMLLSSKSDDASFEAHIAFLEGLSELEGVGRSNIPLYATHHLFQSFDKNFLKTSPVRDCLAKLVAHYPTDETLFILRMNSLLLNGELLRAYVDYQFFVTTNGDLNILLDFSEASPIETGIRVQLKATYLSYRVKDPLTEQSFTQYLDWFEKCDSTVLDLSYEEKSGVSIGPELSQLMQSGSFSDDLIDWSSSVIKSCADILSVLIFNWDLGVKRFGTVEDYLSFLKPFYMVDDLDESTVMHYAAKNGNVDVYAIGYLQGWNVDTPNEEGVFPYEYLSLSDELSASLSVWGCRVDSGDEILIGHEGLAQMTTDVGVPSNLSWTGAKSIGVHKMGGLDKLLREKGFVKQARRGSTNHPCYLSPNTGTKVPVPSNGHAGKGTLLSIIDAVLDEESKTGVTFSDS